MAVYRAEQRCSSHVVKAVMDGCVVLHTCGDGSTGNYLKDVMLSGCSVYTCDYSDGGDTGRSGLVSVMAMQCVICFSTVLRYIAILHTCTVVTAWKFCIMLL